MIKFIDLDLKLRKKLISFHPALNNLFKGVNISKLERKYFFKMSKNTFRFLLSFNSFQIRTKREYFVLILAQSKNIFLSTYIGWRSVKKIQLDLFT
ncbi:hypothetical protein BpHYR1_041546 [Brachionus plicatilis]|uniref:Uncharacterized protein n=1 Tax=Brachionus plicatilis TaxID=10195 RepID=A0A3M7QGQ3_BRAPC|nr:hypothetical protein BpHYR1_041546 [Brachionus plicatilis]